MAGSTRIPFSRSRSRRSPGCRSRRGRAGASRSTRTRSWFQAASSSARPSRGPTARAVSPSSVPRFRASTTRRSGRGTSSSTSSSRAWTINTSRTSTTPDHIPAFDEVDNALGRNQIRYAIVNRLLARTEGVKGSAEEIASLEIAQTYAFDFPQTLVPIPPTFEQRKTGPVRGPPPDLAAGSPPRRRPARLRPLRQPAHDRERHGRRDLGLQLRQRELVRRAAGHRQSDPRIQLQLRPAPRFGRRRPRQVLPLRRGGSL